MGVFAQQFNADTTPTGPEFRVNVSEVGKQFYPSVAMLANGGYAIAFHASDVDERNFEVMVREFNASGEGDEETQINIYGDSLQKNVQVAAGPEGFIAVWESYGQDGDGYGVYARSFDAVAGESITEFQVPASGERWQYAPTIAAGADGRFVVAWHENDPYGGFWIRTRVFGPMD